MDSKAVFNGFGFESPPQSYWIASTKSTDYPALDQDVEVDVAIVGGGIAGITCAYLLKKENRKVAVIEAHRIAHATTGHTTAKITSQHGLTYSKMIEQLGREKAQQYAQANQYAIDMIEELVNSEEIDCDFSRQSAYIYTQSQQYVDKIQREVDAASSLGIRAYNLQQLPFQLDITAAVRFDNQAQFHPRKYILALAGKIPGDGSHIFEQSRAVDFQEDPCTVITENGHKVTASKMIIASHFPAYGSNGYYFARMYPERSYAVGVTVSEDFPEGMYITAEDPVRSLRHTPLKGGKLIIVAGERHKPGEGANTNTHYMNLVKFAKQTFDVTDIPFRWSTHDYTTMDDVPYVGVIASGSPNVYVATGFRKWGMTNGTASAILLKDLIVKGESPWAAVYDPSRFKADPMVKNLATTNLNLAKHLIGDKLRPVPRDIDIAPGEARIITHDGQKVGIYKDNEGKVHSVIAICTHMGCDLAWNAAELSWDCPCHGSRFTYDGDIIYGPALKSLRTRDDRFNP